MNIPFHSTGMGRKFYELDVPRLIRALEKIGKELEHVRDPLAKETPEEHPEKVNDESLREVLRGLRRVAAVYEHEFRDIDTARAVRRVIKMVERVLIMVEDDMKNDMKVEEIKDEEG